MKLSFLGTASCFPTPTRNVSCTALQLDDGQLWLFDCGEGSYVQLQKSKVRAGRLTKIFMSHLHGDHLYGLPGLLLSIGNSMDPEKAKALTVTLYGPVGLRKFISTSLGLSRSMPAFSIHVVEMVPREDMYGEDWGLWKVRQEMEEEDKLPCEVAYTRVECQEGAWRLVEGGSVGVKAAALVHRVPCFGFVVKEDATAGQLDSDKLKAMGVKPGPIYGKLKSGVKVTLESGEVLKPEDFLGPRIEGRKVAIMGDSKDSREIVPLCDELDVLVHEATMENGLREKAIEAGHSTPDMAAEIAIKTKAKTLVLFHLSPRYKPVSCDNNEGDVTAQIILNEASEKVKDEKEAIDVIVVEDLDEFEVIRQK